MFFYLFAGVAQLFSITTSILSMAWGMASYYQTNKKYLPGDQTNGGFKQFIQDYVCLFLWHFFIIGTRVVAIAMFASYFKYYVFIVVTAHYICMLVWLLCLPTTDFDKDEDDFILYRAFRYCILLFSYLNG